MVCTAMKEFRIENLPQIRREVANTIIHKLSIENKNGGINLDKPGCLSEVFSALIFEIKLLVTEFATNAIEHGIDPKYVVYEEDTQVRVSFANLKKKGEVRKRNGEGGYGVMLTQRFPEIYYPEIITYSQNGFYAVIVKYDCHAAIKRLLEIANTYN